MKFIESLNERIGKNATREMNAADIRRVMEVVDVRHRAWNTCMHFLVQRYRNVHAVTPHRLP